ncbi:VOC family protein [Bacillus sp. CGMCC 1.16607]|uniref:VOC family protein n=1 Tax=Bacillus sp. CGMCC 1.16607 TaxID=3351842 RepID=UPI0036311DC5
MKVRFELFVDELENSLYFYEHVLGFKKGYMNREYAEVFNGSVEIGICLMEKLSEDHPLKTKSSDERKGLGVEIVLVVDELASLYQKVIDSGYPISADLQTQPWKLRDFRLVDPDGYYLRITE